MRPAYELVDTEPGDCLQIVHIVRKRTPQTFATLELFVNNMNNL